MSPTPVHIRGQEGQRVRVAGAMLATQSAPTLMLPMGPEVETALVLCSQKIHARQLKGEQRGYGGGPSDGAEPECMPCWYT